MSFQVILKEVWKLMFYCIGGRVSRLAILTSRLYYLRMVFSLGKMSPKLYPLISLLSQ